MTTKAQIQENVRAMQRIAQGIQAAVDAVPQGPELNGNGRGPDLPHLSKPKHTTSYVSYVSVPEDQAPDYSAAVSFLLSFEPGAGANAGIIHAVIRQAKAWGWEPQ